MHPVALAARQLADLGVGGGVGEAELAQERAHVQPAALELDVIVAAGDLLHHGVIGVEVLAALLEVGRLGVDAQRDGAGRRRQLAEQRADERGLAGAVLADDADAIARLHRQASGP
ncbi:MAG: hypothetical protein V9E88_04205 [Ferruginibacter sp.]